MLCYIDIFITIFGTNIIKHIENNYTLQDLLVPFCISLIASALFIFSIYQSYKMNDIGSNSSALNLKANACNSTLALNTATDRLVSSYTTTRVISDGKDK